jgi:8-oxo-dGTP pyrophosphatase MutT (NUDIX family)
MSERSDERPRRRRRRGKRGTRRRRPSTPAEGATVASASRPAVSSRPAPPCEASSGTRASHKAPSVAAPAVEAVAREPEAREPEAAPSEHAAADATDAGDTPPRVLSRKARAARETSAGGIVYRVKDGEPYFLLIRDSYRNWGFPKGHLEAGEQPQEAAVREVQEETGLGALRVDGAIETIDWFFRFRGKLVHKVCHFYLMRTHHQRTSPQRAEGITACRWARFEEATALISYANARAVLVRAHEMVKTGRAPSTEGTRETPREASRGARHG